MQTRIIIHRAYKGNEPLSILVKVASAEDILDRVRDLSDRG